MEGQRGRHRCVNDQWCRQYATNDIMCNPNVELLCLSLGPFYLLREFGNVLIYSVYVPPSANAARAATLIADCVHKQLEWTPEAPVFILGDFNHCKLEFSLPGFSQYVKSDTRKGKMLDKCYGNIPGAAHTHRPTSPEEKQTRVENR